MNHPLTHEELRFRAPFTVEAVHLDPVEGCLTLTLSNSQGHRLLWWSKNEWVLLTPHKNYLSVEEKAADVSTALTDRKLTSISGYTNFYNNTLVFDHQYILRNLITEDDWGESWGIQLDAGGQEYSSIWVTPSEQNNEFLPLPFVPSAENPYDICSTSQNDILSACVNQRIVAADLELPVFGSIQEGVSEAIVRSYPLKLTLEDDTMMEFSSYWCLSSELDLIAYQGRHQLQRYKQVLHRVESLVGRRVLGFGGPLDYLDSTVFLDGEWRLDQIRPFRELSIAPEAVGWSVTGPVGSVSRKGLPY